MNEKYPKTVRDHLDWVRKTYKSEKKNRQMFFFKMLDLMLKILKKFLWFVAIGRDIIPLFQIKDQI